MVASAPPMALPRSGHAQLPLPRAVTRNCGRAVVCPRSSTAKRRRAREKGRHQVHSGRNTVFTAMQRETCCAATPFRGIMEVFGSLCPDSWP